MTHKLLREIRPSSGAYAPGSAKTTYLLAGKSFLRGVVNELQRCGFDLEDVKVRSNPGGSAVAGEATLSAMIAGKVLYAQICASLLDWRQPGLMWRIGTRPYATDGTNCWVNNQEATPEIVAGIIRSSLRGTGE